ncbi:MAG: UDP-N-acetylmuramate dehydrogenase [Actinomycetota bacterium]
MPRAVDLALDALGELTGAVEVGAPIGPWTSYRLGGPADIRVEAANLSDLRSVSAAIDASGMPVLIVGRGSNMLVSDAGFRGIAIRLGEGFRWIDIADGATLSAGAAAALPVLAQRAAEAGLAGLGFAAAIPASLGGAVRMNAGAHHHEIGEVVASIEIWRLGAARTERMTGRDADFRYRATSLPDDAIVTSATLSLRPEEPERIRQEMEVAKSWRRETQPLNMPNGGSVFKNPLPDHAARLIEEIVGKGERVGGAEISQVHANFIVAHPGARAQDVFELMGQIRNRVAEETGIELEPEIKLIGFDRQPWEDRS